MHVEYSFTTSGLRLVISGNNVPNLCENKFNYKITPSKVFTGTYTESFADADAYS